jgi:hypothetical protein
LRNTDPIIIVSCGAVDVDVDRQKAKLHFPQQNGIVSSRPMKYLCSYRSVDFQYTKVIYGRAKMLVQCRFLKVRRDFTIFKQLMGKVVND